MTAQSEKARGIWQLDPAHRLVEFSGKHMMFTALPHQNLTQLVLGHCFVEAEELRHFLEQQKAMGNSEKRSALSLPSPRCDS